MRKYKIEKKLGAGGMGDVFVAQDVELDRRVAIKILQPQFSASTESQERFLREMKISAALDHPAIIHVYDYGESGGTLYYVMQLVEGRSVQEIVKTDGAMDVHDAVDAAADVADALAYIHPRDLIHRDLKPANVMITPSGKAILLDFGLVKALAEISLTMTGKVIGTPRYMAPEMMVTGKVDLRSDIYQLGCILYEMVTGHHAIPGKSRKEVAQRCLYEVPLPPSTHNDEVDPDLENLVLNALEKRPEERYQDAPALLADIEAYRRGQPIPRRGSGCPVRERPPSRPPGAGAIAPRRPAEASTAGKPPAGGERMPTRSLPPASPAPPAPPTAPTAPAAPGRLSERPGSLAVMARTAELRPPSKALVAGMDAIQLRALAVMGLAGLAGLIALGLLVTALLFPPIHYEAHDVEVVPLYGGAEIRWRSESPYPDALELRLPDGGVQRREFDSGGTRHEVTIRDLEPRKPVGFVLLYPDGTSSIEHGFTTLGLPEVVPEAELESAFQGAVKIQTGQVPVRLRAEYLDGGRPPWTSGGPATRHRIPVPLPPDGESVSLEVVASPAPEREVQLFPFLLFKGLSERVEELRTRPGEEALELLRPLVGPLRQYLRDDERALPGVKMRFYERLEPLREAAERLRARGRTPRPDPEAILPEGFGPVLRFPGRRRYPVVLSRQGVQLVDQHTTTDSLRAHSLAGRVEGLPADVAAAGTAALSFQTIGLAPPPGAILRIQLGGVGRLTFCFGGTERNDRRGYVHTFDAELLGERRHLDVEFSLISVTGQPLENAVLYLKEPELRLRD